MDVRSVPVAIWPAVALPPVYTVPIITPPVHQGSCGACWAIAAVSCYCDRARMRLTDAGYQAVAANAQQCVRYGRVYGCNARCAGGFTVSALAHVCRVGYSPHGVPLGPLNNTNNTSVYRANLYDTFGIVNKYYIDAPPLTPAQKWRSADNIAREIVACGTVCATFNLFTDFAWFWKNASENTVYSLGMYVANFSDTQGSKSWSRTWPGPGGIVFVVSHSVTIIGFGSDPVPHWLCRSSWGESPNRPRGLFRIARGVNMCGIESDVLGCHIHGINPNTQQPEYGQLAHVHNNDNVLMILAGAAVCVLVVTAVISDPK